MRNATPPPKRSEGALPVARVPLPWPEDREFRILSIDGGGIRGVFAARVLEMLEERHLGGRPVADYFDMIAGTSTGGILALGLGAGKTAGELRRLYADRGSEVFPYYSPSIVNRLVRSVRWLKRFVVPAYSQKKLEGLLQQTFGERLLGTATTRLCVPASEGRYGEPFIFKTPHHPDFRLDTSREMRTVALATGVAPTWYRPLTEGGYRLADGGMFVNDPIMVGLTDALSCFSLGRRRIRILSVGSVGQKRFVGWWRGWGGFLAWATVADALFRLQSKNAQGQASLLIGRDRITRIEPPASLNGIALDDWKRSVEQLVPEADRIVEEDGARIASDFFREPALAYVPAIEEWRRARET